MQIELTTA